MKKTLFLIALLIPAASPAQNFQGMSEADMNNMMLQLEQMETCMEKIDQSELEKLEQRSQQMEAEIQSLCNQGKRDKAQQRALEYGREMADNPTVLQMQECGAGLQGMLPGGEMMQERDHSSLHVCDQ